jgi:hypothetical protein
MRRIMVLKFHPLQPMLSHTWQSYSNGLKDIRVLWDEQPPRTFARECLICEFPEPC